MEHIRILVSKYLNSQGKAIIGGVESYITALCDVGTAAGYTVSVYQEDDVCSCRKMQTAQGRSFSVIGVGQAHSAKALLAYIDKTERPDYEKDILVFATDYYIAKNRFRRSVAIQHGVAWDIIRDEAVSVLGNCRQIMRGSLRALTKYWRYRHCKALVCVDYNFLNWYRTQVAHLDVRTIVIPNFARCPDGPGVRHRIKNGESRVSIVFARRLVDYRGTKLFTESIRKVLAKHPCASATVAGVGPDEKWMRERLEPCGVTFTSFRSDESIVFHSRFDIAVVPTKGSEGTSLSLLEAMSAGCAVIATNVGGMTNIIIDGYNGLLIDPSEKALTDAIEKLVSDVKLREYLADNAQQTVRQSFSFEKWRERWEDVLRTV